MKHTKYLTRLHEIAEYVPCLKDRDAFFLSDIELLRKKYKEYHRLKKDSYYYPPKKNINETKCIDCMKVIVDICNKHRIKWIVYKEDTFTFKKNDISILFFIEKEVMNTILDL